MYDQNLVDAANALSRAIGGRWGGWYAVGIGRDKEGASTIRISFDQDYSPPLTVHTEYNGYRVHLKAMARPAAPAAGE